MDWKSQPEHVTYDVYRLLSVIVGGIGLYLFMHLYKNWQSINTTKIFSATMFLTIFVFILGTTYGRYVRDVGNRHTVTVKDGSAKTQTIDGAKLILFTSHHVVLRVGATTTTYQTGDIIQISSSDLP
jgi:hypothetical protein